jgi:hypothetical protein
MGQIITSWTQPPVKALGSEITCDGVPQLSKPSSFPGINVSNPNINKSRGTVRGLCPRFHRNEPMSCVHVLVKQTREPHP